jgi:hypothetical protein
MLITRIRPVEFTPGIPGYQGFSQPLPFRPGQRAWVPWIEAPGVGLIALREFVGLAEQELVFARGPWRCRIPSPFVRRKCATLGLQAGSPVLIPWANGSRYGRIVGFGRGDQVLVQHAGACSVEHSELSLYELIPLDGSAHFGAPVIYRTAAGWGWGQYLSSAGGRSCWLLSEGEVREKASTEVRPMSPHRFRPGQRVSALCDGAMRLAAVLDVSPGALSYRLAFDHSSRARMCGYAQLCSPLHC